MSKTEIYKGFEIEKNDFGYFEAFNLNDCDAFTLFNKSLEGLKVDIDELN